MPFCLSDAWGASPLQNPLQGRWFCVLAAAGMLAPLSQVAGMQITQRLTGFRRIHQDTDENIPVPGRQISGNLAGAPAVRYKPQWPR